ncbi:MAG: tripartite tricarboxylate transporter substrate binding protein [Proteobacteria bacterium]|nr:tripartite tricarboxylate transporter substrate binding protein [Pseudomonadota bacterium]MBU2228239.1 tripartite tricarboxylate transporter substrate binding protein [Pseudomonadota bacterium]MBU2261248.1 tripartite tricarboxylate transporter substrate binding protein [Pseudomonadota bacterium]
MKLKRFIGCFCMVLAAVVLATIQHNDALAAYPDKPINYIISFNPGGESDVTARLQQSHLEKILGVTVNVTHKPGGGGAVAWSEFQRTARPDGYTIIGVNIPHIIAQPMERKDTGYTTDGFELIMWFHFTPNALIVQRDGDIKTLADFIKLAKAKPKAVTVAGSGTYSANHLDALRLDKLAGIQTTYVPHTGTGPIIPALMGGHVTSTMNYTMVGVQYKDKLRTLAVAADARVAMLPDVPTFKELGYDIVGGAYRGVAVPKGTPPDIVKKLTDAFLKTTDLIAAKQREMGFEITTATGKQAIDLVARMKADYGGILSELEAQKK